MEDSDENSSEPDQDVEDDYRPGRSKDSFTKSNRGSNRSRSATAHIKNPKQLEPGQDPFSSFSGMN